MGASPLVTVGSTLEYLDDYTVKMPPKDAEAYNYSQIDSYQASIDIEKYIDNLSEKLGVDLKGLLENYGYY